MANADHVSVLLEGSRAWNEWRCAHPDVVPDLGYADLEDVRTDVDFTDRGMKVVSLNLRGAQMQGARLSRGGFGSADFEMANLRGADLTSNKFDAAIFRDADLQQARLVGASFRIFTVRHAGSFCQTNDLTSIASVNNVVDVIKAAPVVEVAGSDFTHAKMRGADMREAKLNGSIFIGADLTDADLRDADLSRVDLSDANLSQADLQSALLLDTKVHRTKFTGARVYGISAWNLDFENTEQSNLVLTPRGEPMITVGSLEVAQFVYLLVKNPKIRDIINTVGQKSVLILGSFGERMEVLDAIRAAVREHDLLPIVFDFERPEDRDLTETIMTLAGMSRFIVADISSPRSVPLELQATVPNFMIPFVPLIAEGQQEFAALVIKDVDDF